MVDWLLVNPTAGTYDGQALTQTGPNTGVSWLRTTLTVSGRTKHVDVEVIQESNVPEAAMYLTTEIQTNGTIGVKKAHSSNEGDGPDLDVYYSVNNGTWVKLNPSVTGTTIEVSAGDVVRWKCNTNRWTANPPYYVQDYFCGTSDFIVYGNIMSLLYGDDFLYESTFPDIGVFKYLFWRSNVTDASRLVLPALSLTTGCYSYMFSWSELVTPPSLPATTLAPSCYKSMFEGCEYLIQPPVLPATKMEAGCYWDMFWRCHNLTSVPDLPAMELADNCYDSMFEDCYGLTTVQSILPATTLYTECYRGMYAGCTGITESPVLPAPVVGNSQTDNYGNYSHMFANCSSLSAVTCLATSIGSGGEVDRPNTFYWLLDVSPTGVFTKSPNMSSWTRDENGIPPGWTVQDYQE